MKSALIITAIIYLFTSNCKRQPIISLKTTAKKQIIAIQPLDNYNVQEIAIVLKEISCFYNKQLIILKPIEIPGTYFNQIVDKYSGDSIIILLSKLQNDSIVEIVGLTHERIYTIKEDKSISYYDEDIFGMGYLPGNSCVISDFRFMSKDTAIFHHRMRNVIIHEIGHNAGLPHCSDNNCIMSKTNGNVSSLDNGGNDYCNKCKKKLN